MSALRNRATSRIVAAMDGSAPSVAALRWAVHLAELSGGRVDAVIAWQYPLAGGGLGWAPIGGVDNTDYAEFAAKSLAEAVAKVGPPTSVAVSQLVVEGYPARYCSRLLRVPTCSSSATADTAGSPMR